jgi:hypothetical protein
VQALTLASIECPRPAFYGIDDDGALEIVS